ncbi:hypothetical protein [Streptomyces cucumeris]|uniref:hypothetical protein n=1 Tax=Streptomyces cucumeris TaxID=2962890 RepID=UPI0020C84AD4|nr:hypothetical protein [Streptomyces sp. NEAU-Y11]MCP9209613.1 hypothetical protein [Streptomyces sp. NEAU-Y11]
MEFTVEFFDYGRHGVTVKEPRTGLLGEGRDKEEARDDLVRKLWQCIEWDDIPPSEGPARTIETITV